MGFRSRCRAETKEEAIAFFERISPDYKVTDIFEDEELTARMQEERIAHGWKTGANEKVWDARLERRTELTEEALA